MGSDCGSATRQTTVALVPAYNEGPRIATTVRALVQTGRFDRVVVIDDGSTDSTSALATAAGATVVRCKRRGGKGRALETGIRATDEQLLALVDADLGESASEIVRLLAPIEAGRAEVAIASMSFPGGRRGFGLVTGLARWAVARWGRARIENPLCGQRVLTRAAAEAILPLAPGFAVETRATIQHLRARHRILLVPTRMDHRRTGRDLRGALHRLRQLRDVGIEVSRWLMREGLGGSRAKQHT